MIDAQEESAKQVIAACVTTDTALKRNAMIKTKEIKNESAQCNQVLRSILLRNNLF